MNDNELPKEALSKVDYAELMRNTLNQIKDVLDSDPTQTAHLINLTNTAMDYLFYLEDNRRVVI
jgi:hypothetical protein